MLANPDPIAELFYTPEGIAFADLMIDGHRETWPIRSLRLRTWLRRKYYEATGEALVLSEINSILNLLEARAQFEGPQREVNIRVAEYNGRIHLDC